MNNQKIDNQLNLAMEIDEENREKSVNLDVGYDKENKIWQLIVKYAGSLDNIRSLGVSVVELFGGYAIMTVPEGLIDLVSETPEIIYIEKPKRLNYSIETGKRVSCINQVQRPPYNLHGQGCIVAVIDSGERVIIMSS